MSRITRTISLAGLVGACFVVGQAQKPVDSGSTVVSHRPKRFNRKLLALTIDDGPDPNITPKMLAALRSHHGKATFFVLGVNAASHPELLKQEVAEDHEIGSHTYTHALHPSREEAATELGKTAAAISRATGQRPTLFRPPGGNMKSWTAKLAIQQGYKVILWTLSSADTATHSSDVIANNILHTPSPGDIVLMHDSATKAATAEALSRVLDELGRQGWKFITVSEMLREWAAFDKRREGRK